LPAAPISRRRVLFMKGVEGQLFADSPSHGGGHAGSLLGGGDGDPRRQPLALARDIPPTTQALVEQYGRPGDCA